MDVVPGSDGAVIVAGNVKLQERLDKIAGLAPILEETEEERFGSVKDKSMYNSGVAVNMFSHSTDMEKLLRLLEQT